jgi:hypothetical protein
MLNCYLGLCPPSKCYKGTTFRKFNSTSVMRLKGIAMKNWYMLGPLTELVWPGLRLSQPGGATGLFVTALFTS